MTCKSHPKALRTAEGRCAECRRIYRREYMRRRREVDYDRKIRRQATESARRYRERNPHKYRQWKGLPEPTRPKPEVCEITGCALKATCLDHDHATGKFRGWLCRRHNTALGLFGDSVGGLMSAVDYLVKAEA